VGVGGEEEALELNQAASLVGTAAEEDLLEELILVDVPENISYQKGHPENEGRQPDQRRGSAANPERTASVR
jgi:hypothetical protein